MTRIVRDWMVFTTSFVVSGAAEMRSGEGGLFTPDRIEVTFERDGDGWVLETVEVGGSPTGSRRYGYECVKVSRAGLSSLPQWVRDFVATVDPVVLLAGGS